MVLITEKYFDGDMNNKEPVGEVYQVFNLQPVPMTGCCVQRESVRNAVKAFPNNKTPALSPVVAILPTLQSGRFNPLPGPFCSLSLVPAPTGSMCEIGRYATLTRMTFKQAMGKTAGGAPSQGQDDAHRPVVGKLLSDEEMAALPVRRNFWGALEVTDAPTGLTTAVVGTEKICRD
jgi:hypothetical protein